MQKKVDKIDTMVEALKKHLDNMTPEQLKEAKEFFKDDRPKGWLSIEDHLPHMFARDIAQGYSHFKIKFKNGNEGLTQVADHNTWYYYAKEEGVTHWYNE